ncbi:ubiquinol-cytochrome-c reductase complex assembly factor 3-like [Rhineura floridana]|uniref:ubiquinol-cytochrome-c reductase complex assembly factor 3-like n=1 Tax=Rhineura floridana TaxID=261503 RepID=UPI002AC7EC63|nr:ubiquinol-cytochrome-c reductase complex assembly factor 3-like [Rhineura floridana]
MGTLYRLVMGVVAVAGCTGVGVALWTLVAPDEAHRKEMAKEYPESNPLLRAERQQQNVMIMEILKEAAETNQNVASKPWPWRK